MLKFKSIIAVAFWMLAYITNGLNLRAEPMEERELATKQTFITPIMRGVPIPIHTPLYLKCTKPCPVPTKKARELTDENMNTFQFYESDFDRELAVTATDILGQNAANYTGTPAQNYELINGIQNGTYTVTTSKTKGAVLYQLLGTFGFSCDTIVQLGNFLLSINTNYQKALTALQPKISKGKTIFSTCYPMPITNTTAV